MGARILNISVLLAFALIASTCTKDDMQKENTHMEQSDTPIYFSIPKPETTVTRAGIYTPDNLTNHSTLGGNFSVSAYVKGTDTKYIDNARVWYFADFDEWSFSKYGDKIDLYNCYWPKDVSLDFFAYMPMHTDLNNACITQNSLSYNVADGPSFSSTIPLTSGGQENLQELIYAFTPDKNSSNLKETTVLDENGNKVTVKAVELEFKHPFAVVYLKLKRGHRMKLETVSFDGMKYIGNYKHNGGWTLSDDTENLVVSVGKRIPQEINYGNVFAGPFLVLPQDLSGVTMSIKGITDNTGDSDLNVTGKQIAQSGVSKWEAGKAYTYSLDLGDNAEEVLFEVSVEAWDRVGYKHIIDVE